MSDTLPDGRAFEAYRDDIQAYRQRQGLKPVSQTDAGLLFEQAARQIPHVPPPMSGHADDEEAFRLGLKAHVNAGYDAQRDLLLVRWELAVIDTAPREAGGAAEAGRLADLVLIPCRPSAVDLATIPATLAAVGVRNALAVLNACPPRGSWTAEAAEAVRGLGLGLAPVTLGMRVAHAKAFTLGRTAQETEPASPAAHEIEALYRYCMEALT